MPKQRRLILGDCFKELPRLTEKVHCIITDPPYDLGRINTGGSINSVKKLSSSLSDLAKISDITKGYEIEEFADFVTKIQGKDINCYFFCNKVQIPEYIRVYVYKLKCKFDLLCWHKQNALPTYSNKYLSDTEYVMHFYKGVGQTHPQTYEDAKTYYMGVY